MSKGLNEALGDARLYRAVPPEVAPTRGPSWATARRVCRPWSFVSRRSHGALLVNRRALREPRPTNVDDDENENEAYPDAQLTNNRS